MLDGIDALNKRFYALYGELFGNKEILTGEQRDLMAAKLLKLYKREYDVLEMRTEIERAREEYMLRLRNEAYIPRSWRFLGIFRRKYNRAAALAGAQIAKEVERYFEESEDALAGPKLWDASVQSALRWYAAIRGTEVLLPLWTPGTEEAENAPQDAAEAVQEPFGEA